MNAMPIYYNYKNPIENFFKFSLYFMYPRHSQTMTMVAKAVLFMEFADLQVHYDPVFGSLYITGNCCFCFYFFSLRDFVVPLFHP